MWIRWIRIRIRNTVPDELRHPHPLLVLVGIILEGAVALPGQFHQDLGLLQLGHLHLCIHSFIYLKYISGKLALFNVRINVGIVSALR
jgi:hypothetical protein